MRKGGQTMMIAGGKWKMKKKTEGQRETAAQGFKPSSAVQKKTGTGPGDQ